MPRIIAALFILVILQACAKNKCVVCNDANGKSTGMKCFHTTDEAQTWIKAQNGGDPTKALDCSK